MPIAAFSNRIRKEPNYEGMTADCTAFIIDKGSSLGQLNQHYYTLFALRCWIKSSFGSDGY